MPRTLFARMRWILAVVGIVAAAGTTFSALSYKRYQDVWFRKPPKVPACVLRSRVALREQGGVSGTEPHDDAEGKTVYLTSAEDLAVRCVSGVSDPLSAHFVTAFSELEPERRALELLKVVRDWPKDTDHDRDASMAYLIAEAGIQGLPKLPETKAALEELEILHACRFGGVRGSEKIPCPSRPPIPLAVWFPGAPSAAVLVGLVGLGITAGVRRLIASIRARLASKKPAA